MARRPARTTVARLMFAAAVALIAACGTKTRTIARSSAAPTQAADTYVLSGSLLLHDLDTWSTNCLFGLGGFQDIRPGAPVTLTDEGGTVIGIGTLKTGQRSDAYRYTCDFSFTWIPNVPSRPFYGIEVAHRGVVRYSFDQLNEKAFTVELTLG